MKLSLCKQKGITNQSDGLVSPQKFEINRYKDLLIVSSLPDEQ